MNELTIGRLSASVEDWPDRDQVPQMLRGLARSRLQDAVRSHPLPAGEYCVRRIDVALELDPDRPTSALETEWADRIVLALRRSLRDGSQDVVRYDRREQAVDDLLRGLAVADHARAWAWRQVGVLTDDDPAPAAAPREIALRVLARLPHGVSPTLRRLVDSVGVAAVHRLLGDQGWVAAAALALRETGAPDAALHGPSWAAPDSNQDPAAAPGAGPGRPERRILALALSSPLAAAFRASSLRADAQTQRAWAVLVLAGGQPAMLHRPGSVALVSALAAALRPTAREGLASTHRPRAQGTHRDTPTTDTGRSAARSGAAGAGSTPSKGGATAAPGADLGAAPAAAPTIAEDPEVGLPEPGVSVGEPTEWGGLLFLLNSAADAGLPEALDVPPLDDRPQPWLLQQLALRLVPAAPDDAAVLALSGAAPGPLSEGDSPSDGEAAALDRCAGRWVAATAARLRDEATGADGADDQLVRRLVRRDAQVLREPGWVEVLLCLDEVELDVRRAGLDIDPGWVWWLGQVVRFRYE